MNNQIVKSSPGAVSAAGKPSALRAMAARISMDEDKLFATLKATVFKGASNEELAVLVAVSNEYDLNPMLKEIYAFPAKGGGIVPIVSVDGWNKMLLRQKDFDGIEFEMVDREDGTPYSCTATIHIKSRSKAVKITEYFDECYRKTDPWENMPRRMLRNRTLCQASRIAFGFSGINNDDEAATMIEVSCEPVPKIVKLVTETSGGSAVAKPDAKNPTDELADVVIKAGHSFDDFRKWGKESGNIPEADDLTEFADVKIEVAKRLLRAKAGLLQGLENLKALEAK